MNKMQRTSSPFLYLAIALSIVVVFVADLLTPLGIAVWVMYFLPLGLALFAIEPLVPPIVALSATLAVAGTFYTDIRGIDPSVALINRAFGIGIIWVMAGVGYLFIRNRLAIKKQEWLQLGQASLSQRMLGEQSPQKLGENILGFLAGYLGAQVGTLFIPEGETFTRLATYALSTTQRLPLQFKRGEGLLGQAVIDGRILILKEVPENYLQMESSLGQGKPKHILIAPLFFEGAASVVIELGFADSVQSDDTELLTRVTESITIALRSAKYRSRLQELLEETQRQAEELQAQSEELRVSNEELEEQSRALRESQVRMEQQQSELEQTNSQLEEQAQLLEAQKEDVSRANLRLEIQANELEQASRYKSEFLANMSHELRTPLNSSLILSKLLADNRGGNLTEEQVRYAQTIQASGNDLLMLINDVLDLSKIEAGRMEIKSEEVRLSSLLGNLTRVFEPLAAQKALSLKTSLAPDAPQQVNTDSQRLEQILKNLISNAIKFTEKGEVVIEVRALGEDRISFAVRDTGVGIPLNQQELIFDAFRQADGTNNRKYGGTGLGLSISKELTRLLGGEITLKSEVGMGSTFTLVIPVIQGSSSISEARETFPRGRELKPPLSSSARSARAMEGMETAKKRSVFIEDDRDTLKKGSRLILTIEDDEKFARILCDLAHELNFQCIIAASADEGFMLAVQYLPSAILLDIVLPDHLGLSVLDRLKRDARTRHIPVHVVSGKDYIQEAFSLGAVGYMLKPVKREELVEAFGQLEARLDQKVRRVLVVEDDEIQLESLRSLIATKDIETAGARSEAECLEKLKNATFDCMVLDLGLTDGSGFSLLETLSREDRYSFPPVIVYTGRELSADEEQTLRRYSNSIIIKGAKSPERLLDEVTLFLHQVVSELTPEQQKLLAKARSREEMLEGKKILVVEDDVRNVFAITSILEPAGVQVRIARNGREALEVLERSLKEPASRVDLVLMDIMMPEMDGFTAIREIRKKVEWKKLPIIALTAKAMKNDQEQCLEAGANDYLAKPLDIDKLLSLIRVWIPR